jgi:hypothetical protein
VREISSALEGQCDDYNTFFIYEGNDGGEKILQNMAKDLGFCSIARPVLKRDNIPLSFGC